MTETSPQPPVGQGGDGSSSRRDYLLSVGLRLFASHAYDELSIDDIAAEAGVAKGLLYYYFSNKRAFYIAVIAQAADNLRHQVAAPALSEPPGQDRLARTLEAYLTYVQDCSEGYRALLAGGIGSDPQARGIIEQTRDAIRATVLEGLPGSDGNVLLITALTGWVSFVEGASLDWLSRGGVTRDQLRDLFTANLTATVSSALGLAGSQPSAS
jgi:AcrR family transcriptional regulator